MKLDLSYDQALSLADICNTAMLSYAENKEGYITAGHKTATSPGRAAMLAAMENNYRHRQLKAEAWRNDFLHIANKARL